MSKFIHLISSVNPNEIEQIKLVLNREGIETNVNGEMALQAGNIELSGISGASIRVHQEKLIHAKKVLKEAGFGSAESGPDDKYYKYMFYIFAFIAFGVIAYMAYISLF